jgi:hypothetical protein
VSLTVTLWERTAGRFPDGVATLGTGDGVYERIEEYHEHKASERARDRRWGSGPAPGERGEGRRVR